MALQLIRHAFAMIFGNLGQALKISLVPYGLLFAAVFLFSTVSGINMNMVMDANQLEEAAGTISGGVIALLFVLCVFALFVVGWMAVSWHRFILNEEYVTLIPAIANRPIWPYVGRSILYGFFIALLSIPLGFLVLSVGSLLTSITGLVSMLDIAGLFASVVLAFVLMRWSIALPAISVGRKMTLSEAWNATAPYAKTILGVAAILTVIAYLPNLLLLGLNNAFPLVVMVISIFLQWLTMMLGLSILTTLYGHIIEKRPLVN